MIVETLRHTNNYFIANIFTTGFSFLTLPIFTLLMSESEIGIYSVFMAMSGFVMVLLGLNLYGAVSRYYFEDKQDFDLFLGTSLILTFFATIFGVCIYFLFEDFFDKIINLPYPLGPYLILLSLFLMLDAIYRQILIVMKQSKKFFWIVTSKFMLILVLSIIIVYLLPDDKYLGRIWPLLLINFIYAIYYIYTIIKLSKFQIKRIHVKYLLLYSIPLIPYTISGYLLNFFDRIFINYSIGSANSGLYSIGYSIATIIALGVTSIHSAQTPEFFKLQNQKEYEKYFLLIKRLFSLLVLFGLGLILFSREVLDLLTDPKFHSSYIVIPPVVLGYLFNMLFFIYGQYIGYEKKTGYLSIIIIASSLVNVFFNVLLIPKIGIVAGAYTTLISYMMLFFLAWVVSKFILKQVIVPLKLVIGPMVLIFIFLGIYYFILNYTSNFIIILVIKIILIVSFLIIVFYTDIRKVFITK